MNSRIALRKLHAALFFYLLIQIIKIHIKCSNSNEQENVRTHLIVNFIIITIITIV